MSFTCQYFSRVKQRWKCFHVSERRDTSAAETAGVLKTFHMKGFQMFFS